MLKRLTLFLPVISLMALFSAPRPTQAVTLPNTCARWVSCGNKTWYCATQKGQSCGNPTFYEPNYNLNQSVLRGAQTTAPAKKGVTYGPTSLTKYVWKYKYVWKNGRRTKVWYKVKVVVTVKKK